MQTINNKKPRVSEIQIALGKTFVHQYIRQRRTKMPVGVVLATTVPSVSGPVIKIGWAQCNVQEDNYDKTTAFELAIQRAHSNVPVPVGLRSIVRNVTQSALRYFKGAQFEAAVS